MENQMSLRDTQMVVDLGQLAENMDLIRDMVGPQVKIMAVVKANAYGHGAVAISQTLLNHGADWLAVATLGEALELREAYPQTDILILGYTPDRLLPLVLENNLCQVLFELPQAKVMNQLATEKGCAARVQIKIDTGLHRLGFVPSPETEEAIAAICHMDHIQVDGIFTHLILQSQESNERQYQQFCQLTESLEAKGCHFPLKHIADSISGVDYPQYRLNMIRPGSLLYGMHAFHIGELDVKPAMYIRTKIAQIHHLQPGEGASYDWFWTAKRPSIIATLPIGYADGLPRRYWPEGYVAVNGVRCPYAGLINMDQCMVDVTDVPGIAENFRDAEVILIGDGKHPGAPTIHEISAAIGNNRNDLMSRISARVERVYLPESRV